MRIRRTRSMKLSTWRFRILPKYFICLSWIQFWVRVKLLMNLLITVNPVMRRSSELLAVDQSWYRKLCRELFIFLFKVWHFRCCSSDCVIKWKCKNQTEIEPSLEGIMICLIFRISNITILGLDQDFQPSVVKRFWRDFSRECRTIFLVAFLFWNLNLLTTWASEILSRSRFYNFYIQSYHLWSWEKFCFS